MTNKEIWTEQEKRIIWNKGLEIPGYDPREYRQDFAGAWMQYSAYGNTTSELNFGWEIDHIKPEARGGSNYIDNLQPIQWKNNRTKSDNFPVFYTSVTSLGYINTIHFLPWTWNNTRWAS